MRGYHRVFITLQEDTPGYAAGGRPPQGRCVVEVRYGVCGVKVYLQDLRPQVAYKVYLISSEAAAGGFVCLGGIDVGQQCRGEGVYELIPGNAGAACPVEAYDAAAVVVQTIAGAQIVLSGGTKAEGAGSWRHRFLRELSGVKAIETAPVKETAPPAVFMEPVEEDELHDASVSINEDVANDDITERLVQSQLSEALLTAALMSLDTGSSRLSNAAEQAAAEAVPPQEPNPAWKENAGLTREDDPHLAFKAIIQRFNQELEELSEITSVPVPEQEKPVDLALSALPTDSLNSVFAKSSLYWPFGPDCGDWTRITLKQLASFPVSVINYELNAFIAAAFYRHGHLLVSKTVGGYALAAPANEPEAGELERLGFREYKKALDGIGYWIMDL